jgi:hypothetical protein
VADDFTQIASELVETAAGFHARGWVLGTSGNLSAVVTRDPDVVSIGVRRADGEIAAETHQQIMHGLRSDPQPASSLRLVRLHGRSGAPDPDSLARLPEWIQARELLARVSAPPSLTLDPGGTPT